jgi:hypothetical protein
MLVCSQVVLYEQGALYMYTLHSTSFQGTNILNFIIIHFKDDDSIRYSLTSSFLRIFTFCKVISTLNILKYYEALSECSDGQ